jgi:hypothetical protein
MVIHGDNVGVFDKKGSHVVEWLVSYLVLVRS